MNSAYLEIAAANTVVAAVAAFIGGLFIAGALIWAVQIGMRVRRLELRPPRPDEQPRLPAGGAVHEIREMREPDEVPLAKDESERLMPYELHHGGGKLSRNQKPPTWSPGSSGSFGSGGPGHT
ncbi:DUF6479 family protein [Streptomyces sp. NPDC055059]|jgi:hypothetical protein|uniref:DUF6479 family protein n=1 Tax=unclassified Streptomyces TaxID=2593676 RepID=UPI003251E00F